MYNVSQYGCKGDGTMSQVPSLSKNFQSLENAEIFLYDLIDGLRPYIHELWQDKSSGRCDFDFVSCESPVIKRYKITQGDKDKVIIEIKNNQEL
jgi:hypothetical protein